MIALAVSGLVHVYREGAVRALDGVDLAVGAGERVALIGQNGSGKTTLVRHLNGLLRPTEGRVLVDGVDAATHDAFRGVGGSFEITLRMMADANRVNLPLQVNTTITRRNLLQIDAMAKLLAGHDIALWSVFFLIPVGRGRAEQRISEDEFEWVFERLWELERRMPFAIKTTEAPHYRRFAMRREADEPAAAMPAGRRGLRAPLGTNDGRGVMFISHTGQVFPSGFLPLECGRFPRQSVVDVYQQSPVFRRLRDADLLEGKCGVCEFRQVCGGSRARAYALTRNYMAAEPDCSYVPVGWTGSRTSAPAC